MKSITLLSFVFLTDMQLVRNHGTRALRHDKLFSYLVIVNTHLLQVNTHYLQVCQHTGVPVPDEIRFVYDMAPVKRNRSLMARLLGGILPLEVKVGRFMRTKKGEKLSKDKRWCTLCKTTEIEDEIHFPFKCTKLEKPHEEFITPLLLQDKDTRRMRVEMFTWLLKRDNIKSFGAALAAMFQFRQDLLYK